MRFEYDREEEIVRLARLVKTKRLEVREAIDCAWMSGWKKCGEFNRRMIRREAAMKKRGL